MAYFPAFPMKRVNEDWGSYFCCRFSVSFSVWFQEGHLRGAGSFDRNDDRVFEDIHQAEI